MGPTVVSLDGMLVAYYTHRERAMSPRGAPADGHHERIDRGLHIGGTIVLGRASLSTVEAVTLRAFYLSITPAHVTAAEYAADMHADGVVESFVDWRKMGAALGVAPTTAMRSWSNGREKVRAALNRAR